MTLSNVAFSVTRWRRGRHVLRVDAGGHADFRTIGAAVDYAATHPAPQPERIGPAGGAWWIIVEPGSYWERPFTLPAHTYLIGTGFDTANDTSPRVVVGFGDDSQGDMITFSRGSCLAHLAVYFLGTSSPFWSNSISGPTRVVHIPGIASGYWQIYGCLIAAQVDSTAQPVTAVEWDGAGQVFQQLQVLGSQISVAGPPTLGNAAGLRVRQATGTGTSLLVRDSELVSTFGEPAVAIDAEGLITTAAGRCPAPPRRAALGVGVVRRRVTTGCGRPHFAQAQRWPLLQDVQERGGGTSAVVVHAEDTHHAGHDGPQGRPRPVHEQRRVEARKAAAGACPAAAPMIENRAKARGGGWPWASRRSRI